MGGAQQVQIPLLPIPQVDLQQLEAIQDPSEKKQFVGNAVYPQIEATFGSNFAGKITGMLLDENVVDFNQMLTNQVYFSQKAREAMTLLQMSQPQQLAQPNVTQQ